MVEFINSIGGKMYVDESRVEEYKGLGYKPAPKTLPKKTTKKPSVAKKEEK